MAPTRDPGDVGAAADNSSRSSVTDAMVSAALNELRSLQATRMGIDRFEIRRILEAATSATSNPPGLDILRLVAAIPLWRDTYPDATIADAICNGTRTEKHIFGITPGHILRARAIVAGRPVPTPDD